ncbi:MAG: MBL fold metallo-hydrolase [Sedimentisphaerales bacterium]|nr:MBL fold metallo-hydrolase [Sedimentisphaerales bacterium]
MASHNLAQITVDDLEIIGYSAAGEENVVALPQLDVCFDAGKAPQQIIPINHLLLTHGHMDHSAGIAYWLSQRNFCGIAAGTLLAPEPLTGYIKSILDAWGQLDGNPIPVNLVGVKAGDEYQIKPNLFARVFATKHSRGSVGYTVLEKRKKLKPEYVNLSGAELVALKKRGVAIDSPIEMPLVSYLGDTQYGQFAELDYVMSSKILIAECTFFLGEHLERAQVGRHMHADDMIPLMERSKNRHIVLMHITQRTGIGDIRRALRDRLPKEACEKILILSENVFYTLTR